MTDLPAQAVTAKTKDVAPRFDDPDWKHERLVPYKDLKLEFGIPYTLNHLRRMWKRGEFPVPLQISPHRIIWRWSVIKTWIERLPPSKTVEPPTATDKDKPHHEAAITQPPATRRASHSRPTPRRQRSRN